MARKLWVSLYMLSDDGAKQIGIKKDGKTELFLPKETIKGYEKKISENIGKGLSRYVSAHPEKYQRKEGRTA